MMMPHRPEDLAALKRTLEGCDRETKQLLGPLLHLPPVQQLLVSFLHDTSRSFEDHVWDPMARDILNRLREAAPALQDDRTDLTNIFQQELYRPHQAHDYMADVDSAHEDGKRKFARGDHYAAFNAFKRALEALVKFHQDDHYGHAIDPEEWEEQDLRARYVTLCVNVAVCALKLKMVTAIRDFASKALAVDEHASKALYVMAKVHIMEHMYEDARAVAAKALSLSPENESLIKLEREIDVAEQREQEARVQMAAAKLKHDEMLEEEKRRQAELEQQRLERFTRAEQVTPLPLLRDSVNPGQRLNIYFMRIKHQLLVEINQLHNPDNGESPLFECNIRDGTTGAQLATGVKASSKKGAKTDASMAAIQTLWDRKKEAGTLLPADLDHLAAIEATPMQDDAPVAACALDAVPPPALASMASPVELTVYERQKDATMLLNQLNQQRRLAVVFDVTDVSTAPGSPSFECTCSINGRTMGVARALSKKKAKADAAQLAYDNAVNDQLIVFVKAPSADHEMLDMAP
ncbi:hypothetical protein PINS_up009870 [Pythium insidiosum]|nr:hypothetical protein PINS_up009870 [Pythium insidiosum]